MFSSRFFHPSLVALPFFALLASCQKEDDAAPVTELTLRDELTFLITPAQQGDLDLTATYDARASVEQLLQEKGFSAGQLRDVRIEDARAVMMEPLNIPFNALENVRLDFNRAAGAPVTFAHLDPVPVDQGILELFVDHTDLTSFFQDDAQTVHARLNTVRLISGDTARVRFALTFRVKAGE